MRKQILRRCASQNDSRSVSDGSGAKIVGAMERWSIEFRAVKLLNRCFLIWGHSRGIGELITLSEMRP